MSDEWIFFPCQMGQHSASIFFDYGIRASIDSIASRQLLKVRVSFKRPQPNGMPANDEFQHLTTLEDGLVALLQQQEGIYVGRISVDGHRHFFIYSSGTEDEWSSRLDALGKRHDYPLDFALKPDSDHSGYWKELFPTDDDWQVIQDLGVIEALEKHGDDGATARDIDHWAYFPSRSAAEAFACWTSERGYGAATTDISEKGEFQVHFSHAGTVLLTDITSHTIALRRKASELGGNYDGWETQVCKASP